MTRAARANLEPYQEGHSGKYNSSFSELKQYKATHRKIWDSENKGLKKGMR